MTPTNKDSPIRESQSQISLLVLTDLWKNTLHFPLSKNSLMTFSLDPRRNLTHNLQKDQLTGYFHWNWGLWVNLSIKDKIDGSRYVDIISPEKPSKVYELLTLPA